MGQFGKKCAINSKMGTELAGDVLRKDANGSGWARDGGGTGDVRGTAWDGRRTGVGRARTAARQARDGHGTTWDGCGMCAGRAPCDRRGTGMEWFQIIQNVCRTELKRCEIVSLSQYDNRMDKNMGLEWAQGQAKDSSGVGVGWALGGHRAGTRGARAGCCKIGTKQTQKRCKNRSRTGWEQAWNYGKLIQSEC